MDLQSSLASLLMETFARSGVRDVVVSPGSRSTPFVLAALDETSLCCHSVVDERSAAFFALGIVRACARPVILLCTSGSAAAHYYPAIIEAAADHLPLIVISADRPSELQHCGANQTIDQTRLFGVHARAFFDLDSPRATLRSLRAVRQRALQAVVASQYPDPGPVHINAPARKPLERARASSAEDEAALAHRVRLEREPQTCVGFEASTSVPDPLVDACKDARRGLLVVGAQNPLHDASLEIVELAQRTRFPTIVDAGHGLRYGGPLASLCSVDTWLKTVRGRELIRPDFVLQIGRAPSGGGWEAFLDECACRWVVADHGWPDPWANARGFMLGSSTRGLAVLGEKLPSSGLPTERDAWSETLGAFSASLQTSIQLLLKEWGDELTEAGIVRAVIRLLSDGHNLVLGNSLAIRHADRWAAPPEPRRVRRVFSQRGASGIDGNIASAVGAARATRRATLLLLGDVSLVHDLGSLALTSELSTPLVIVVVNNQGGRIFDELPIATEPAETLRYFRTPTSLDVAACAKAYGCDYGRPQTLSELLALTERALAVSRTSLIEAFVDPAVTRSQNQRLLHLAEQH